MAAATIIANTHPLANTSQSRQNHIPRPPPSAATHAPDGDSVLSLNPQMSFSLSQGSQGGGLMVQPGASFRQYETVNAMSHRDSAPQIYSAVYSGVDVYEMEVNRIAVMRRRKDSWLNATQILKVAGIEKGKRTKVLEKEILIGEHEKVQGGYGKYQGTWIKFERGLEFCRQYGVEELLRPLLTYDMGQDGGVAGQGGIDTPTKEQAMAAQRKRLYNTSAEARNSGQSGTFFKNISSTASHAVAAISKARFDSPAPRIRNGGSSARPASFSRQSSQQQVPSQESTYPSGSQQSIQSFMSGDYGVNGLDSAYATQSGAHFSHTARDDVRNGDFDEPPRKRIKASPSMDNSQQTVSLLLRGIMNDTNSSQVAGHAYFDLSMREATPTEANDSFYHPHTSIQPGNELPISMMPLSTANPPSSIEAKKALLMSLFTDPSAVDFANHPALRNLSVSELDMPIDKTGHTALHWATTLARLPLLKALIACGASIFRVNNAGETALMRACVVTNNLDVGGFPDLLELLGPTIEVRDVKGRTVLHHIAVTSAVKGRSQASKYYLESLLEFVVRQGTVLNTSQDTVVDGSSSHMSISIGRFMSEIVNVQDSVGDTALNIAARIGNRSIISQLLEVGADPAIPNRSRLCPIDFGIGFGLEDAANPEARSLKIWDGLQAEIGPRKSSSEIISSITSLLAETEKEFTSEMEAKQSQINGLHAKLRESSITLGEERRRLEALRESAREFKESKLKIANLTRAVEDEQVRLTQLQQQYGVTEGDIRMQLGDADKVFSLPNISGNILSNINPNPQQPQVLDQAQQRLLQSLPSAQTLRARLNAYTMNNKLLEQEVRQLEAQSMQTEAKYRKIISLSAHVKEEDVDSVLSGLLRAVDSERSDVELGRVREFLQRVDGNE